jgi:hypothetical protein
MSHVNVELLGEFVAIPLLVALYIFFFFFNRTP